eukprot:15397509-Heterocapsa_arctica.AAC.1
MVQEQSPWHRRLDHQRAQGLAAWPPRSPVQALQGGGEGAQMARSRRAQNGRDAGESRVRRPRGPQTHHPPLGSVPIMGMHQGFHHAAWLARAGVLRAKGSGCAADWQAYELALILAEARAKGQ